MNITEDDWADLESEQHPGGVVTRRLFPRSANDIFLAVQQTTGRRMLVLQVPATAAEVLVRDRGPLPATRGLALELTAAVHGRRELHVVLNADDRREVFNPLIADMATVAATASGPGAALTAAVDRFEHWRRLLQGLADAGLGAEARRGLYGEMVVLRDHVLAVVPAATAVAAWTGPTGANQDFQFETAAIEVKTTSGRGVQTLPVASERQLDSTGVGVLLLAHLSVDERRAGTGESLNAIIDTVRGNLPEPARGAFGDLLVRVGYLNEHRAHYEESRYTVRETRFWRVEHEFPRIVERDLRHGVSECSYRISVAGLDRYRVPEDRVAAILKGES